MSLRILQVGVGIRGGHWVEIVRDYPDARCVGFVDRDEAALAGARAVAGGDVPCFTDLDSALSATEADAALIATPSVHHAEHAGRALDAGLAVMVEKPFAITVNEALGVLERATAAGRPVMVAENYRFWPSERTVRKLVAEGRIGRVDHATLVDRRRMPSRTEGPWLASIEHPQLQEVAIHHFDSLRYFFAADPTAVTVRSWNSPWSDYRGGANTDALLELGDIRVQYLGTMTSHRFSFSLWIEGEAGVVWTNRKYVAWRPPGTRWFRPVRNVPAPPGDEKPYPRGGTTSLLDSLRDAALGGRVPETHGGDNIWNVAMVEAGVRSDRERRTVRIEEVFPAAARVG